MELISIIIPVYNVEHYVRDSILSALEQTYPNIEYLIVDDCGSDNSIAIIQQVLKTHKRAEAVSFIRHDNNKGVSAARNTALAYAHGDYVYFMDPDDRLIPDCITLHHKAITKSNSDLTLANIKVEGKQTVHVKPLPEDVANYSPQLSFYKLVWNSSVCNRLYKMSVIKDNALQFNTQLVINEDCAWNYEYVKHCSSLSVVEGGIETYIYTYNTHSVTRQTKNALRKLQSQLLLIQMMRNDYMSGAIRKEFHLDFVRFIDFYRFCSALMMLNLDYNENINRKDVYHKIQNLSLNKVASLYGRLLKLPYYIFCVVITPLYRLYKKR